MKDYSQIEELKDKIRLLLRKGDLNVKELQYKRHKDLYAPLHAFLGCSRGIGLFDVNNGLEWLTERNREYPK